MSLTRDQILTAQDEKRIEVDCPEWGGSVFVGTMTAAELERFETIFRRAREEKGDLPLHVRARIAAVCCRDENGKRLFTELDIPALAERSGVVLDRILDAAMNVNGIGPAVMEGMGKG